MNGGRRTYEERSRGDAVGVRRAATVLLAFLWAMAFSSRACAQQHIALPPVNLGGTSFMDGVGGPGLLVREALGAFGANRFVDSSGVAVPGQNKLLTFSSATLVAYMPPFKVLGGNWGVEVLVPLVYARLTTPFASARATGLGDVTFSPLVWQAPPLPLIGGQFFQRLDFDLVAPTGQYSTTAVITAGSNLWSANPYYAWTWLGSNGFETSWRLHYLWSSRNAAPGPGYAATTIQPGQAVHVNGAASIEVVRELRVGVAGYFLRQVTDSQANGHSVSGSRERVAGIGPGFLAQLGAVQLVANGYAELAVENRPRGIRVNAVVLEVW